MEVNEGLLAFGAEEVEVCITLIRGIQRFL